MDLVIVLLIFALIIYLIYLFIRKQFRSKVLKIEIPTDKQMQALKDIVDEGPDNPYIRERGYPQELKERANQIYENPKKYGKKKASELISEAYDLNL
tara:strand:+ start:57 stop:347 length:291 start_codon:yes stop_codon:yes gene_type:complete